MTTNRMPSQFKRVTRTPDESSWTATIAGQRVDLTVDLWLGSVSSWWHSVSLRVNGEEVIARQSRSYSARKADQRYRAMADAADVARKYLLNAGE